MTAITFTELEALTSDSLNQIFLDENAPSDYVFLDFKSLSRAHKVEWIISCRDERAEIADERACEGVKVGAGWDD